MPASDGRIRATHPAIAGVTIEGPRRFRRRPIGSCGPVTLHVSAKKRSHTNSLSGNRARVSCRGAVGTEPVARITAGEQRRRGIGQIVTDPLVVGEGPSTSVEPQLLAPAGT